MQWIEFLDSIKNLKNNYASKQVKVDFGTLSKLLFAGAFSSMFDHELSFEEIQVAVEELKKALGSQAELGKANKTELFGTEDIDAQIRLLLWRNQVLPTTKFQLSDYFKNALIQLGLREKADENNPFSNNSIDLWTSWNSIVNNAHVNRFYLQRCPPKNPAFIGMIEDVSTFNYKEGKEALRFRLFTGIDCVPSIVVWAERDGKVHPALKKMLVKKSYGVAIVSLKLYREDITANLIEWHNIRA